MINKIKLSDEAIEAIVLLEKGIKTAEIGMVSFAKKIEGLEKQLWGIVYDEVPSSKGCDVTYKDGKIYFVGKDEQD